MDEADWAKRYEQEDRERAINAALAREQQPPQQFDDDGQVICIECGDRIAPARLAAKPDAARCTDCKSALEQRQRLRRK